VPRATGERCVTPCVPKVCMGPIAPTRVSVSTMEAVTLWTELVAAPRDGRELFVQTPVHRAPMVRAVTSNVNATMELGVIMSPESVTVPPDTLETCVRMNVKRASGVLVVHPLVLVSMGEAVI